MYILKSFALSGIFLLTQLMYCQPTASSKQELEEVMQSNVHDTIKMQFLYTYINAIQISNDDEAQQYTDVFYQLIKKNNYKKGLGFYYLLCAYRNTHKLNELECYNYAFKAAEVFKEINALQDYLVAMEIVCSEKAYYFREYDAAYNMASQALVYTKDSDLKLQKGYLYKCMAYCKTLLNDYASAIKFYAEASFIFNSFNDLDSLAGINVDIAQMYLRLGRYKESLEYSIKAENIFKKNGFFFYENVFTVLSCKGNAYYNLKNYTAAKEEFTFASKMPVTDKKKELLEIRMALVDFYLGNIGLSYMKADSLLKKVSSPYTLAYCNYCKALCLISYNRRSEATKCLNETIRLLKGAEDKRYEDFKVLADANKMLVKVSAIEYNNQKEVTLLKEASSLEKQKEELKQDPELNTLVLTSDLREKNWEVKRLSDENAENSKKFKKQHSNTLLIGGLLFSFLFGLGYIFVGIQKRHNKALTAKNTLINLKKAEIEQKLAEKALLVKEIHHRVKNNFQLVISLLYLQVESEDIKNIQDFLDEVTSRMLSMAMIHQSLYITENSESINFKDYINELTSHFEKAATNSNNLLSFNIEMPDTMIDVHRAITLGLVINEMILNSIKHVQLKNQCTTVDIHLQLYEGKYLLIYKDDGSASHVSKDSFGTELIHLLVKQIKGELSTSDVNSYCYSVKFNII